MNSLRPSKTIGALLTALALGGCDAPAVDGGTLGLERVARSGEGMVVSGAPQATAAGARVLAAGGNAADAAVATALALAVVEPSQSGLGGRTQVVFRTADGQVGGIDATTVVPADYDPATAPQGERGHAAVGIPGTVPGLGRLHGEHGVLPWADVVLPALELAREGFELHSGEAARLAVAAAELAEHPSAAALFLDETGAPPAAGDRVVQPALARVLEALMFEGSDLFHRGWVADSVAADLDRNGGFVTAADLAGYQAMDAVMARGRYGDLDLVGSWLPAGGATSIQALQILDAAGVGPDHPPSVWAPALTGALTAAYSDRETAQHWSPREAVAWITSDSLAARHGRTLRPTASRSPPPDEVGEPEHTTHVAVTDSDGFVVALTQSLGPSFGAMVATPSLGFLYASTLGGYLAEGGPGARAWSSQSPMIVLRGGRPVLSLGGGGGRRIISAAVSTVARFASGDGLDEALSGPRLHPTGTTAFLDGRWDPSATAALEAAGWTVEVRDRDYFARLNAVARGDDDAWIGAADPIWADGAASGPAGDTKAR